MNGVRPGSSLPPRPFSLGRGSTAPRAVLLPGKGLAQPQHPSARERLDARDPGVGELDGRHGQPAARGVVGAHAALTVMQRVPRDPVQPAARRLGPRLLARRRLERRRRKSRR
jgi:hypothetical protein